MLATGSSLETVDNLPLEDQKNLYAALQRGLWGPYKDYLIAHVVYQSLHSINETQAALKLGKKHKARDPLQFHELFPGIDNAASLGRGADNRKVQTQEQMAAKAAAALISDDAPAWLKQAAQSA